MAKNKNRRRRRGGVPTALVVILLVIAIVMGGLFGFVIARRIQPADDRLEQANQRIIELENTLNLIGFPMEGEASSAEDWTFDDTQTSENPANDLAGIPARVSTGEEDVWGEDLSLVNGGMDVNSDPVVVAEYDGGQLMSTEIIPEYNDQLATQVFSGYSADEVADSVLQSVLQEMTAKKLVAAKIKALGLDAITDEERKAIEAQAREQYKEQISYYAAFIDREGLSADEIDQAAEKYMNEEAHITVKSIADELLMALPQQKYYDYVVKDIAVTDEDIQTRYDEMLKEQKTTFSQYPEEYENAHLEGKTLIYNLEGYRAVLNLQLPFESDGDAARAADLMGQLEALNPLEDAEKLQAIEAELNPLYAPLEVTASAIEEKLKNGERFEDLMAQYGADEMMAIEPVKSEGYYISDHSYLFSAEFIQGSMILESPGQVSTPLRSASGLHLTYYLKDITPGEVPLQQVYETIKADALKTRQDAAWESHINAMLEEANVQYYPERMQ